MSNSGLNWVSNSGLHWVPCWLWGPLALESKYILDYWLSQDSIQHILLAHHNALWWWDVITASYHPTPCTTGTQRRVFMGYSGTGGRNGNFSHCFRLCQQWNKLSLPQVFSNTASNHKSYFFPNSLFLRDNFYQLVKKNANNNSNNNNNYTNITQKKLPDTDCHVLFSNTAVILAQPIKPPTIYMLNTVDKKLTISRRLAFRHVESRKLQQIQQSTSHCHIQYSCCINQINQWLVEN